MYTAPGYNSIAIWLEPCVPPWLYPTHSLSAQGDYILRALFSYFSFRFYHKHCISIMYLNLCIFELYINDVVHVLQLSFCFKFMFERIIHDNMCS